MKLLPYDRLTLRTSDAPGVVAARLAEMVAVGWFFLRTPPQPFRGSIAGTHFKVMRVLGTFLGLRYRNGWQPVVVGDIVLASGGTEVRIRMRLHAFAGAFAAVWFGGLLAITAIAVWTGLRNGVEQSSLAILVAVGMGLFMYALVSLSFWSEAKKARALLREGLGCVEVERPNRLVRSR